MKHFYIFRMPNVVTTEAINDKKLFPDLPAGPLERYRQNAKFDYRRLSLLIDGERRLRFRVSQNTISI